MPFQMMPQGVEHLAFPQLILAFASDDSIEIDCILDRLVE
jgi:hypothetical protein